MIKRLEYWHRWDWFPVALTALLILVLIIGPRVENLTFPVVDELDVISVRETEDGDTIVRATLTKRRNCNSPSETNIHAYLGQRGELSARLIVEFLDPPMVRASGVSELNFKLYTSKDNFLWNSWADVTHRCPAWWKPTWWRTESQLWTGRIEDKP